MELNEYTFKDIVKGLTGECYPYGSSTYDEERYLNLIIKTGIVDHLVDEMVDAGKLYNRSEYSILKISNTANDYLAHLRDWLCDIEYLRPREIEEE